jgi:hypothetical protein
MVGSNDNQGLVHDDFSDDAVKIDEQSGLDKSPIEQVWDAVLTGIDTIDERGCTDGSREFDTEDADAKEQDKTADTPKEMMESGTETAQEKIQEATNPEGCDAVDYSEISIVKDQSSDAETLKELSDMLETAKESLSEIQEKIQEATKGE